MEYRYLDKNEKYKIKDIYLEIFDDPDEYVKYYTDEYSKNTDTFVCEKGELVIAMANIHYKNIYVFNRMKKAAYIYGVATKKSYRNKGIMTNILTTLINDLKERDIELIYLVPAISPSVYEKLGFRLIRDEKKYIIYDENNIDNDLENCTYEIYRTYENDKQMIRHMKNVLSIEGIDRIMYKINPIMIYERDLLIQSVEKDSEHNDILLSKEKMVEKLSVIEFKNKYTLERIYNGFMYNDEV